MLKFDKNSLLIEDKYEIEKEPQHAALFTTGNGYIGVRGSFEEFGSLRVQGAFIRGLFHEIVEVIEPFPDNEYMRNYYFNEEKLKDFETQDSIINFADILLVRVTIGSQTFYPWTGKIIDWKRYLDPHSSKLVRNVLWDDGLGNITSLTFERFSSFANRHLYCLKVTVKPINHELKIKIISGIDTKVKTGGQRIIKSLYKEVCDHQIKYKLHVGPKYNFETAVIVKNKWFVNDGVSVGKQLFNETFNGILANGIEFETKMNDEYTLEKIIYVNTSRDYEPGTNILEEAIKHTNHLDFNYNELFNRHLVAWKSAFSEMDVQIEGDLEADSALRFSTYHTLISASFDSVHSISAKSLSGERYNNFVWWDCEIYQLPIFIHTLPEVAKNALLYRYRLLNQARENAKLEGFKGARYPFVSSVNGDEKVWIYARHPFLQVHITADIGFGVLNYYHITKDRDFLVKYGMEMLIEISRYWLSRVTYTHGKYEILNVTGTDEHHPYVNNDAYTNYLVHMVLKGTMELIEKEEQFKIKLSHEEMDFISDVTSKLYLPMNEDGLIPQFDGYFNLSRTLEIAGNGTGKGFQMKQSGLYHKSQIIKQPDVMLIYSYLNADLKTSDYAANWDYYEHMCETSSSLSYPVHAICAADTGRMLSFYNYFMETVRMDIDDIHHNAWQGIHAGCAAGGWYSIFRGIFGLVCREHHIDMNPQSVPWWKSITLQFVYQGNSFKVIHHKHAIEIIPNETNREVLFNFRGLSVRVTNQPVMLNV